MVWYTTALGGWLVACLVDSFFKKVFIMNNYFLFSIHDFCNIYFSLIVISFIILLLIIYTHIHNTYVNKVIISTINIVFVYAYYTSHDR